MLVLSSFSNQKGLDAAGNETWTGIGATEGDWAWAIHTASGRMKVCRREFQSAGVYRPECETEG